MTDEFQKGLITGLAMQPLQVTTEHAEADPSTSIGEGIIIGPWTVKMNSSVIVGEVITIPLPASGTGA